MKTQLQIGDTIRLRSNLKVHECYDGFEFLESMDYGFARLRVVDFDDTTVLLQGPDNYTWWYPFAMLDLRTLRKARENK